ncbi:importin-4-like [Uloborus diversus]|uniref:importin-4-like n=1 Tax=Uloborus diversus TaxID=327109 RepID=UPI00240923FD|nr:importin-4-like [Uloborus diversus]
MSAEMHHLEPALQHQNPHHKKAAYLAISVIAEGCSEFIRYKYLQNFVQIICRGIKDQDAIVRNAALYAVGQYAEYLQPDISKYASELLPVLFEHLDRACVSLKEGNKDSPSLLKTFYAVERFCENLEDIVPYLPTLMCCLTTFLGIENENSVTVKELAVEAIGSVAAAAKEHFVPYFPAVVEVLKKFISETQTDVTRPLQIQSIDTLAIIARSVGTEVFLPIAHECVKCGLHLMQENDDPDIRRSCYGLFASVSVVLKADMAPYLSTIVDLMHITLKSAEGISINTSYGDSNTAFTLFEDDDDDDEENGQMNDGNILNLDEKEEDDDDDDDVTGYSVENSYMEEKEGACLALKEMCEEVGLHFVPYIGNSFNEVKKLTESPSDDIRRAAISCLTQFCISLNQIHIETGNLECRVALEEKLATLMPKMFTLAREDTEHTVVISCLENLQLLVDKVKQITLYGGNIDAISSLIKDVFKNKLACQDEDGDEDDQEAEYDSMVMEYAGELIASLIKVVPWQQFAPYLAGLMPLLLARTKKACTTSEKSFAVGTLADIVSSMEPGSVQPFLVHLQPVFLSGMKDENEEVRSNAVYGLGVLIQNAGSLVFDQYSLYLQALSNIIASEQDARTKDNICGAVARLIKSNPSGVPLKEVFPALIHSLPLQEDLEENSTVFECLSFLHSIRAEEFFQNLPHVVKVLCEALSSSKLNESTVHTATSLLKNLCSEFPQQMDSLKSSFPQESIEIIEKVKSI